MVSVLSHLHAWTNTWGQVEDFPRKQFVPEYESFNYCLTNIFLKLPVGPCQGFGKTELIHGFKLGIVVSEVCLW